MYQTHTCFTGCVGPSIPYCTPKYCKRVGILLMRTGMNVYTNIQGVSDPFDGCAITFVRRIVQYIRKISFFFNFNRP